MKDQNVKAYYEKEAYEYDEQFYVKEGSYPTLRYRHNYMLKMVGEINLPENAKILDVGCGPGEMVRDLIKAGREIHGIDIAIEMVNIAKEKIKNSPFKDANVHLAVGDIEKLTFEDDFFDLIIVSGVVEYLKDDETWLAEINRTLKKGGFLIINVTNKYSVAKWTSGLFEKAKSNKRMFNFFNFFKEKVLNKGKLHYFPFRPRVHSPKGFDSLMAQNGYEKIRHNYFDFAIFPAPLDTLLGFVTTPLRRYMEKFSQRNMVFNGTGYIVLFKKTGG